MRLLNSSVVISAKSISSVGGGEDERQMRSQCVKVETAESSSMEAKLELKEVTRESTSLMGRRPGSTPVVKEDAREKDDRRRLVLAL